MLRWASVEQVVGLVTLLTFLTWPDLGYTQAAVSFDPKKLESSSQVWSGYPHILSPSFEDTPQNVTALAGDSAFLPCTVSHLGDRSVTWMRKRDLHILTAGVYTYSADDRFMVLHPENSDDWTLHIKFANERDAGVYECQVNSDPKISLKVTLTVKDSQLDDPLHYGIATTDTMPLVAIEGPTERHIQRGSVLAVTCVVRHPPHSAPDHILWFHGPTNIDYDSARGGVSIQTEKSTRRTVSKLMLSSVDPGDTGEYSCSPTDLQPAVVTVHVQDGAAWYTTGSREPGAGSQQRMSALMCDPSSALYRGQIQQPVKQGPGLSTGSVTASVSSALLALVMMTLACIKCRMFA
ncbi:zwei Ig domain protein zig-8 isoform X5 [Procambarus clarkii]|uniref:zwei Ig domain protein zig-8 isoform X5 n=1 Tax=Procambarus clarkii TaxID=6728 RepID=UPI001E677AD0|nr:zwei Ig domain protein zig-8-like isoform X5 [Procambarus clarkii]